MQNRRALDYLTLFSRHNLEELRKITRYISQDSQSPCQDFDPAFPETSRKANHYIMSFDRMD